MLMAKKIHKGVAYAKVEGTDRISPYYYKAGAKRVYVTPEDADKIQAEQAEEKAAAEENTETEQTASE